MDDKRSIHRFDFRPWVVFRLGQSSSLSSAGGSRSVELKEQTCQGLCPASCNNTTNVRPTLDHTFSVHSKASGTGQHCCTQQVEVWHRRNRHEGNVSSLKLPRSNNSYFRVSPCENFSSCSCRDLWNLGYFTRRLPAQSQCQLSRSRLCHVFVGLFRGFRKSDSDSAPSGVALDDFPAVAPR